MIKNWDWEDYIKLASDLYDAAYGANYPEASYRSAISRAYYGVFCLLRNYLHSKRNVKFYGGSDDHKKVEDGVGTWSENEIKKSENVSMINVYYDRFRIRRNSADYDDKYKWDLKFDAQQSKSNAGQIASIIGKLT